jgi:hypothetical protein
MVGLSKQRIEQIAHPERSRARMMLRNALDRWKVQRPTRCERCGAEGSTHGHHEDYSRPLIVVWLCPTCHGLAHADPDTLSLLRSLRGLEAGK